MNFTKQVQVFLLSLAALSHAQILTPRIIGGYNVSSIEGFEHQVSIRDASYESSNFGSGHLCGGTLIDYDKVLTAAHCVHSGRRYLSERYFIVVMGSVDLFDRGTNTLVRRIKRIYGHPKYNADTFENDLAVLILVSPIPTDHPTARPIPLSTLEAREGQSCMSSGWGTIEYSDDATAVRWLMAVDINVNSRKNCNRPSSHDGGVQKGMFCAGPFEGGKDTCQGDSGGPFVCSGVLVGVTSHGFECGLPNYPGIYMDIGFYRKWILNQSKSEGSSIFSNVKNYLYSFFSVGLAMLVK